MDPSSNVVRIEITNGNYIDINLSALNNPGSDNQDLTGASYNPSNGVLTIDIQNGNSVSVNLSSLINTDNQILSASSDSIFISNGNGIPKNLLTIPDTDWIVSGNNIYNGNVGNIGIGTSNPGSKLNIKGPDNNTLLKVERNGIIGGGLGVTYRGNNEGYEIQSGDQGGISLEALGNHELRFETNGQERMLIEGNGNISMGSSGASPSTTLDISGSLTVQKNNQNNGGNVFFKNLPIGNNYNYNYQSVMIDTTNGKLYRMSSADGWGGYPGGSVWTENGSDIYYDLGNVGVGTNNPQKSLHVYGEVSNYPSAEPSNGNDGVFIDIQNAGLGYQKVAGIRFKTKHGLFENAYYHAGIFFRGNPNDLDQRGTLYFSNKNNLNSTGVGTADADMVIKSDGKIGIGLLNPDEQLHVDGKLKIGSSSNGYTFPSNRGINGQVLTMGSTPGQLEWVSNSTSNTKEIYLSAHDFYTAELYNYPSNPNQTGGYPRHVVVFGNGGGTAEGMVHYDFPKPTDWTGSNMTVTIYYSSEKNDGNIRFSIGAASYSIGQGGYNSPAPDDILTVPQKYTLYSYTKTLNFINFNSNSALLSLALSRYDYQYPGLTNPDTNTGKMFLHAIKITYPTN